MKGAAVAKRFAKALFEIGVEEHTEERYANELRDAVAVFKGNPELYRLFLNPMYKITEREALIGSIGSALAFSPNVLKFFKILIQTRNIKFLEEILAAYRRFEDEAAGRVRAVVESPSDITPALVEELRGKLKAIVNKDVVIAHKKNPDMIGGLVVRMGNTVMDSSLKTQLEAMKKKIVEGVA
ncbi:ATP synthase F1 subunit delta [bacterium]|nr:MAG: ATP synthase F1 subunit delta [bacterium]